MFLGVVPEECLAQIATICELNDWSAVYVCCSGTFRFERALAQMDVKAPIHSNDVSLFSSIIAGVALSRPFPITFRDAAAELEERFAPDDFLGRAAAVLVLFEMSRWDRKHAYAKAMYRAMWEAFDEHHAKGRAKLSKVAGDIRIADYHGRDWRAHMREAIGKGAGVVAFPPFFKGGYERMFKFLERCVEWPAPAYDVYDPKELPGLTRELHGSGAPYLMLTEQELDGLTPVAEYTKGRRLPHRCYGRAHRSSSLHIPATLAPFRYTPAEPEDLREDSVVEVSYGASKHVEYIRQVYIASRIKPAPAPYNFLVWVDGRLLGALSYSLAKWAQGAGSLYLLSDVCVSRRGRLSKLLAALATSSDVIGHVERKSLLRFGKIVTTAFSEHPVSMKYRGLFELLTRKDGADGGYQLQYESAVRRESCQTLYRQWWARHGKPLSGPVAGTA